MNNADAWLIRFHRLLPDAESRKLAERFFEVGGQMRVGAHPLAILLDGMAESLSAWEPYTQYRQEP